MHFVELQFEAELADSRSNLPPFLGATLRGALGRLLKQTVCQVAGGNCEPCLLQTICPYPAVFEGLAPSERDFMRKYPRVPQPFVLIVPSPDDVADESRMLTWGIRLFGSAERYWPYVIHIFNVCGELGIGRRRCRYRLNRVTDGRQGAPLWSEGRSHKIEPVSRKIAVTRLPERCALRWRLETPLRIKRNGRWRSGRLEGLDLLLAGRRRFQIMNYFYGDGAPEDGQWCGREAFVTRDQSLQAWGFRRYSGRQKRRMNLHGLIGEAVIEGPWGRVGRWLHAVKSIHLGKATSFGFGRVDWEVV